MKDVNPQLIKETLSHLRRAKTSAFLKEEDISDFKTVMETCRIVDAAMLPIFYIWEHYFHRKLKELSIEKYLIKPYKRFSIDPWTNTWEIYLLLKIVAVFSISAFIKRKLFVIYDLLLLSKEPAQR